MTKGWLVCYGANKKLYYACPTGPPGTGGWPFSMAWAVTLMVGKPLKKPLRVYWICRLLWTWPC